MKQNTVQALVLVGGRASRLKKDGVQVNDSKAFLKLADRPLLYWNLCLLHKAGIRKLVVAAQEANLLYKASRVVSDVPFKFSHIDYFQDYGLGVHGIPYELRYLLDDTFLFECGHSLNWPSHYEKLLKTTERHKIIFTAYKPHLLNRRQPVSLRKGTVQHDPHGRMAIAHPMIGTHEYAKRLAYLGFDIDSIIQDFSTDGLTYVPCDLPPEFDIKDEMQLALESYKKLIANIAMI